MLILTGPNLVGLGWVLLGWLFQAGWSLALPLRNSEMWYEFPGGIWGKDYLDTNVTTLSVTSLSATAPLNPSPAWSSAQR